MIGNGPPIHHYAQIKLDASTQAPVELLFILEGFCHVCNIAHAQHEAKTKLRFAVTTADKTALAIGASTNGNNAVPKTCGQCNVMCGGKCKIKSYIAT